MRTHSTRARNDIQQKTSGLAYYVWNGDYFLPHSGDLTDSVGQLPEGKVFPGKNIAFPGAALVAHSADPFYNVVDVDDAQAAVSANDHSIPEDTLNNLYAIIPISAPPNTQSVVDPDTAQI